MSSNPWWQQFWSFLPWPGRSSQQLHIPLGGPNDILRFWRTGSMGFIERTKPHLKKIDKLNFIGNLLQIRGVGGWWGSLNIPNHQGCSTCLCPVPSFFQPNNSWIRHSHLHHWLAKFHGLRSCAHPPPSLRRGRIDWNLLNWNRSKSWYLGRWQVEIFVEAVARVSFFPPRENLTTPKKLGSPDLAFPSFFLSFWGVRLVSSSLGEEEFNFKYGAIFWVSSPFFHNCMWNSMGNLPIFRTSTRNVGNLPNIFFAEKKIEMKWSVLIPSCDLKSVLDQMIRRFKMQQTKKVLLGGDILPESCLQMNSRGKRVCSTKIQQEQLLSGQCMTVRKWGRPCTSALLCNMLHSNSTQHYSHVVLVFDICSFKIYIK